MGYKFCKIKYFREMTMKDYIFGCPACRESFSLYLPEKTKLATFNECEEKDINHHNFTAIAQCKNCQVGITVYYCIDGHT
jgi:hypothetical protein